MGGGEQRKRFTMGWSGGGGNGLGRGQRRWLGNVGAGQEQWKRLVVRGRCGGAAGYFNYGARRTGVLPRKLLVRINHWSTKLEQSE